MGKKIGIKGVGWGIETIKANDPRRHKSWCEFYRKSDETCCCKKHPGCYGLICNGAAHCDYYSEDPNRKKAGS